MLPLLLALPLLLLPLTASAAHEGASRALALRFAEPREPLAVGGLPAGARWVRDDGPGEEPATAEAGKVRAPETAGIWRLEGAAIEVRVATRVRVDPTSGLHNGYRIGRHAGRGMSGRYAPPEWMVEVTEANQDAALSENFRLRQFLTKDQQDVWPKYLPIDLRLVDKLELVVAALRERGVAAKHVHVMSGYRTPQYNGPGGKGRARLSRHTYGDAADVWIDDDGDGQMDDLKGDGRVDIGDARWLLKVVEEVEARHPELTGGAGAYKANRAHGPFLHVDVRGSRARW